MSKKISELPEYIGAQQPTGFLPISINRVTYKIDPSLLIVSEAIIVPDTVIELNSNNYTQILTASNAIYNGGFIYYNIIDENGSVRTGNIKFAFVNNQISFYEDVTNSIGVTSFYIFSMTNNGTNTVFRFYNETAYKATVTFSKKLINNI